MENFDFTRRGHNVTVREASIQEAVYRLNVLYPDTYTEYKFLGNTLDTYIRLGMLAEAQTLHRCIGCAELTEIIEQDGYCCGYCRKENPR